MTAWQQFSAADPDEAPRGLYLRPSFLVTVLVGGAVGTAARAALEAAFPAAPEGWPWATFACNVVGSFLLGMLLETLVVAGPDDGWRRRVRVGVGTGLLGGFTTYSTFVVEAVLRVHDGHELLAAGYLLGSLVAGGLATLLGVGLVVSGVFRRGRRGWAT